MVEYVARGKSKELYRGPSLQKAKLWYDVVAKNGWRHVELLAIGEHGREYILKVHDREKKKGGQ